MLKVSFLRDKVASYVKRKSWFRSSKTALAFVLLFATVGLIFLFQSQADTPTASVEPENGTISAPAVRGTDSSVSYIQFNAVQTGGNVVSPVSHGSEISASNTGYLAWVGAQGQRCTDANITVYNSKVNASSLGSTATCVWLKGGINVDASITLNACRIDAAVVTVTKSVTINFCTLNPTSPDDWSLGYANFTAYRSQITGSSDGVRYGGAGKDTLIENYIRVKAQSSADHNDGIQMYGASGGGTLLRNNISGNPVGGGGGPNAAIFVADGAAGEFEIRDNYLIGGGYSLRLHDNGYYRVTGNLIEKGSYTYGPVNTTNSRSGAFLEWSNNKLSDGTMLSP